MLCIGRHRGVQLILAYSWARPALPVAGKGRGGAGGGGGAGNVRGNKYKNIALNRMDQNQN